MRKLWLTGAAILGVTLALGASLIQSHAQGYPNRTIRIVVPYAPGGGVSILAQIIGTKMQEIVKQPVVIDNRPGAGGNVGADAVAKAVPDGYTILLHTSAMASAPALYSKLPFDPVKDFVPVSMVISTQFVIAGSPKIRPPVCASLQPSPRTSPAPTISDRADPARRCTSSPKCSTAPPASSWCTSPTAATRRWSPR